MCPPLHLYSSSRTPARAPSSAHTFKDALSAPLALLHLHPTRTARSHSPAHASKTPPTPTPTPTTLPRRLNEPPRPRSRAPVDVNVGVILAMLTHALASSCALVLRALALVLCTGLIILTGVVPSSSHHFDPMITLVIAGIVLRFREPDCVRCTRPGRSETDNVAPRALA
ncbi:hypothetical protein B0H16DRAFT_451169 [Mycena metata]|uniref:Uncharacterized protein n=1 Tax=Mycena metata TaxID=1033252 RepID=A0AAD7HBW4_9AGAR|nr:hypothetical protein B0H16DRAFT_451169 [Mycena metata]